MLFFWSAYYHSDTHYLFSKQKLSNLLTHLFSTDFSSATLERFPNP
jgi:hypothetical protein